MKEISKGVYGHFPALPLVGLGQKIESGINRRDGTSLTRHMQ
jgi:hypothetical protein